MIPVSLTSLKTSDGVTLDGIGVEPTTKRNRALLWIHGLTSRFSSGQAMIAELSGQCARADIGYFKFNTRGHDIVNRDGKDKSLHGGGIERFEDCLLDIRTMLAFVKKRGYASAVLVGHSSGANKAVFYCSREKTKFVKGLVLAGPISDIAAEKNQISETEFDRRLRTARWLAKNNRRALMPLEHGNVISARRYLNLFDESSSENIFPYHNRRAQWKIMRAVGTPILAILGSRDEYLDRPVTEVMDALRGHAEHASSFTSIILKNANHGFKKKEREFSKSVIDWIQNIE